MATRPTLRTASGPITRRGPAPRIAPDRLGEYRRRALRLDGLLVASWVSVALVIAFFLADDVAAGFVSVGQSLTSLGILTGLVGTDLLLVMMLLSARLPLIDKAYGQDRAVTFHKKLGKPVLYLLLAHTIGLIAGYAMTEGVTPVAETLSLFLTVPDMWLAFAGVGLLIAVVVTSIVSVRRRFPYEAWLAVHLLAYVAVLAAVPHQFSTGAVFAPGTWQRGYWLALYLGLAGCIVAFRVVAPVARSFRHRLTVTGVRAAGPGAVTISMSGRNLESLPVQAGQFLLWRFLAAGLWWHAHPFSLSAAPGPIPAPGRQTGLSTATATTASSTLPASSALPASPPQELEITVRGLGAGSKKVLNVRPGTRVMIEGPYGIFTQQVRTSERIVMVGAGIGVAPIRSLLAEADFAPGNATVILRAGTVQEVYLLSEIDELCRRRGAYLFVEAGPRPANRTHWLPSASADSGFSLLSYTPELASSDVYVCGPGPWSALVLAEARAAGVPAGAVHYERFSW
ncbi:ferredoxin reductase family protein [Arthrobacter sp. H14-L1]|uniref:ferredoxin reductase family protein n=1 Tax=Arthrobacter sp. H14-L1 TaxID=2996697 RepID=UPI002271F241|nr:ferredoxin reductase family protein [Arthrobacter sp. H14-L1]MCY0905385.1 ferredoxin reductase family protein [Arthrobacter sp. H14-L1]